DLGGNGESVRHGITLVHETVDAVLDQIDRRVCVGDNSWQSEPGCIDHRYVVIRVCTGLLEFFIRRPRSQNTIYKPYVSVGCRIVNHVFAILSKDNVSRVKHVHGRITRKIQGLTLRVGVKLARLTYEA